MPCCRRAWAGPVGLLLLVAFAVRGQAPAPGTSGERPRLDRVGDPLPPGAQGRLGTMRFRHIGIGRDPVFVTAFAFSCDGKTLAVGQRDGTVSLWEVNTARERHRFPAWQGGVAAVVFAPDGRTLTAVYGDGTARVWEVPAAH